MVGERVFLDNTPVTLSYETHKPVTDYWAENSEQFQSKADRDIYNAAVQSLKDWDVSGERNGATYINACYNYAAFNNKKEGNYPRTIIGLFNSGLMRNSILSNFEPYISQINPSMSDKEIAEICMKAITDNWTYVRLDGTWYFADPTLAVHASDAGVEIFPEVWLSEMNDGLFDGTTGIKLYDEGSSANITMHTIEQACWGRG